MSFVVFADSATNHGPIIGTIKGIRQYWRENLRPTMNSTSKHLLHCCLLFGVVLFFEIFAGGIKISENSFVVLDPWAEYGTTTTIILYLLRILTFLTLPQVLFNFCGLVLYNAFPEKVTLKGNLTPFDTLNQLINTILSPTYRQSITRPLHLHSSRNTRWLPRSSKIQCAAKHEHLSRYRSRKFPHRSSYR